MLTAKVYPNNYDTLAIQSVIQNSNIKLVESDAKVLHFCGSTIKELKEILREEKPDFLINHSFRIVPKLNMFQAYHPIKTSEDWIRNKIVKTNNLQLAQIYYSKLGIQVRFKDVSKPKKERVNIFKTYYRKFIKFMKWS